MARSNNDNDKKSIEAGLSASNFSLSQISPTNSSLAAAHTYTIDAAIMGEVPPDLTRLAAAHTYTIDAAIMGEVPPDLTRAVSAHAYSIDAAIMGPDTYPAKMKALAARASWLITGSPLRSNYYRASLLVEQGEPQRLWKMRGLAARLALLDITYEPSNFRAHAARAAFLTVPSKNVAVIGLQDSLQWVISTEPVSIINTASLQESANQVVLETPSEPGQSTAHSLANYEQVVVATDDNPKAPPSHSAYSSSQAVEERDFDRLASRIDATSWRTSVVVSHDAEPKPPSARSLQHLASLVFQVPEVPGTGGAKAQANSASVVVETGYADYLIPASALGASMQVAIKGSSFDPKMGPAVSSAIEIQAVITDQPIPKMGPAGSAAATNQIVVEDVEAPKFNKVSSGHSTRQWVLEDTSAPTVTRAINPQLSEQVVIEIEPEIGQSMALSFQAGEQVVIEGDHEPKAARSISSQLALSWIIQTEEKPVIVSAYAYQAPRQYVISHDYETKALGLTVTQVFESVMIPDGSYKTGPQSTLVANQVTQSVMLPDASYPPYGSPQSMLSVSMVMESVMMPDSSYPDPSEPQSRMDVRQVFESVMVPDMTLREPMKMVKKYRFQSSTLIK